MFHFGSVVEQHKSFHRAALVILGLMFCSILVVLVFAASILVAQTPAVVTARVETSQRSELADTVRHELNGATDQGRTDASKLLTSMMFGFAKTPAQEAALQQLLANQQNPGSPEYHQWLTPEQYAERFGASAEDTAKVVDWLERSGFANIHVAPGRNIVTFDGNVATAEEALGTKIHNYTVNGEEHFANSTDVQIPAAFKPLIKSVSGLHNFYPKPMHVQPQVIARPEYTSGKSDHYLAAEDIQRIYGIDRLYGLGYTGLGRKLVIVGEYPLTPNDSSIATYRTLNGLPQIDLQVIGTNYTLTSDSGTEIEARLDVEIAGAVAPDASIVYMFNQNASQAAMDAIYQTRGDIVSMSYATCETAEAPATPVSTFEDALKFAAANGITFISSSGDSGAAGCDAKQSAATHGLVVTYPASSSYVTAIGGTTLDEGLSPSSYWGSQDTRWGSVFQNVHIPEDVWNDTSGSPTIEYASGGGVSAKFTKPSWQSGPGVPLDGYRDVPDLAFAASAKHDAYIICMPMYCLNNWAGTGSTAGEVYIEGGTSAATPLFAGIMALVDQKQGNRQGNVNPAIYAIARANYSTVFNDVKSGNNNVACTLFTPDCLFGLSPTMGFSATPGYDLATGWGPVKADEFALAFSNIESIVPAITSWSVTPTSVPQSGTVTVKYTATDSGGSGLLQADLMKAPDSNGQPGTWVNIKSQPLSGSGPAQVTLTDQPATVGKYWYGSQLFDGVGNHSHEPAPVLVAVGVYTLSSSTTTISASAAQVTQGTAVSFIAKVQSTGGKPTGSVTFSEGTNTLGRSSVDNTGTAVLSYSSLTAGTHSITAVYGGDINFNGSTSSAVSVTVTGVSPVISVSPNSGTIGVQQFQKTGSGFSPNASITLRVTYPNNVVNPI